MQDRALEIMSIHFSFTDTDSNTQRGPILGTNLASVVLHHFHDLPPQDSNFFKANTFAQKFYGGSRGQRMVSSRPFCQPSKEV